MSTRPRTVQEIALNAIRWRASNDNDSSSMRSGDRRWLLAYIDQHEVGAERARSLPAPLDVDRLARAMTVSLDIYGWDLEAMARDIAAEYDLLSNQPSTEPAP